ncbi:MAG TPA: hypothetical protein VGB83_01465 [Actinomycetota bacterium]
MYHFAILALLGLALWKFVGMLLGFISGSELPSHVRAFITLALGVATTVTLDYSVFAAWGIPVRASWMGSVGTGLIVGGMTYAVHSFIGLVEAYGRKSRDEARVLEGRTPKAA